VVRTLLGATNGVAAAPGTVRGDFSISKQNNLVHGSDSPESAHREIALWFRPEEVLDYSLAGSDWVFGGA
jgi:nucleoside-diphosphate kinase